MDRQIYMVTCNWAGAVFVKDYDFFKSQGGFTQEWGKGWKPVVADSIPTARKLGCEMFEGARPYEQQAF